jgi:hypothetical protein
VTVVDDDVVTIAASTRTGLGSWRKRLVVGWFGLDNLLKDHCLVNIVL